MTTRNGETELFYFGEMWDVGLTGTNAELVVYTSIDPEKEGIIHVRVRSAGHEDLWERSVDTRPDGKKSRWERFVSRFLDQPTLKESIADAKHFAEETLEARERTRGAIEGAKRYAHQVRASDAEIARLGTD